MPFINKLLLTTLLMAPAAALTAEKHREHEGKLLIETPRKERFYREKIPQEHILFAQQNLSHALRKTFIPSGYNLHWEVPIDCITRHAKRYRGLFPDEILAQIGVDYNLKFTVYHDKNIIARALYANPLSICARNLRVNREGF